MQRKVFHWVSVCVFTVVCVVGGEEQQVTMPQGLLEEVRLVLSAQGKMLRDIRYRTLQGKTQVAKLEVEVRKLTSGNGNTDGGSCNPAEDPSCEPFRGRSMDTLKETQQGLSVIYDGDSGGMVDLLHRLESNHNRLSQLVEYMTAEITPMGPSDSPPLTSYETLRPVIPSNINKNVTGYVGDTALLDCPIGNLGESVVTWIRSRDLQILSVGTSIYANDQRFRVLHPEDSSDWWLRIDKLNEHDAGGYECIASEPHQAGPSDTLDTHVAWLFIVMADGTLRPAIPPNINKNITAYVGDTALLDCPISNLGESVVLWKKGKRVLTVGALNIIQDSRVRLVNKFGSDNWQLQIQSVEIRDDGVYECHVSSSQDLPSGSPNRIIYLDVLDRPTESPPIVRTYLRQDVSVDEGDTAILICRADNLGGNVVSWIRSSDWGLLAMDTNIYTTDDRYSVDHKPDSDDWQLEIRRVAPNDSDVYICDVSRPEAEGPAKRHEISLTVDIKSEYPIMQADYRQNVTVKEGDTAVLSCRVRNLGDASVVWIRMRDSNILTVGRYTFSSDDRISASHKPGSNDWELRIARVVPRDSGKYACQISKKGPDGVPIENEVSLYVDSRLPIILEMESSQNVSFTEGENVSLTCRVHNLGDHSVTWTRSHDQQSLAVGAFRLTSDERIQPKYVSETMDWVLEISSIRKEDAGEYECQVSTDPVTSLTVSMAVEDAPTTTVMPATTRSCPTPFHLEDANLCVLVITKLRLSWNDASNYCRNQSGELAQFSPGSYLQDYLNIQHGLTGDSWNRWPFWVGGLEEGEAEGEISWKWQDGSNVDPAIWAPSHPMSYGRSKTPEGACMILDGYHSYMAASLPCHLKRRFVCIYK